MQTVTETTAPSASRAQSYGLADQTQIQPRTSLSEVAKHYFASALVYGIALLILLFNPWYRSVLNVRVANYPYTALMLYPVLYGCYLILAPIIYGILRPASLRDSKNLLIVRYVARVFRGFRAMASPTDSTWKMTTAEKNAFMFLLIKLYFGPIMLSGAILEINRFPFFWTQFRYTPDLLLRLDNLYLCFVCGIFLLDSCLFFFGYHSEAGFLRNRIRYVETNWFGVFVCILCYPPVNMVTTNFLGPSNNDYRILFSGNLAHPVTWVLRGAAVLFLLLLTSSSLSLFTRASNLTNRGIVDYGPYRYVRHPGYFAKNMFWLMTLIPVLWPNLHHPQFTWLSYSLYLGTSIAGFIGWCTVYCLRALTEERLLLKDPDYVAYCQRVRYRFIPGLI